MAPILLPARGMLLVISSCTQEGSALPLTSSLDSGKQRNVRQKQSWIKTTFHSQSPRGEAQRLWEAAALQPGVLIQGAPPEPQKLFCKMGEIWKCPPRETHWGKGTVTNAM